MEIGKDTKRYIGIISTVVISAIFFVASQIGLKHLDGAAWYVFSSVLRIIFGCIAILRLKKLYGRSIVSIFTNYTPKSAIISGIGFLIYAIYYMIVFVLAYFPVKITGLTISLFLSRILFQQITTGFFEEALFRGLLLEGYFCSDMKKTSKVIYAMISFTVFGLLHITSGWDAYIFLYTGTIGFAFAAIYLNTHNLILPMILHFIFDVPANMAHYLQLNDSPTFHTFYSVDIVMIGITFVITLVMLLKGKSLPKDMQMTEEVFLRDV